MSGTADRLRDFATAALTRAGAVVEWDEGIPVGEALLPPEVARVLGTRDHVRITAGGGDGDLRLDLAGDALERVQQLVELQPWVAAARLADRPAKPLDAAAVLDRSLDIANARVRLAGAMLARVEYHRWHVAVQIEGDEPWEDVVEVAVNAAGAAVDLQLGPQAELLPWRSTGPMPDTQALALRAAAVRAEARAGAFVARLAARRDRDRRRLRDYYGALLTPRRRSGRQATMTPEDAEQRHAAVDLELARKLDEVDERSRLRCRMQPVALLRLELPAWRLDVSVQRRDATRTLTATWNHLTGGLESLPCDGCGALGRRFLARDGDVALLCERCSAAKR